MVKEVKASHILVKTEEEANALLEEINGGRAFEEVAKEKSMCPSGSQGGDLGWFERGMMVQEFEDAAFNAKKDEIVGPIKTQFGHHLIKVVDQR